ncbi:MAG TPA: hypothetical protein VGI10_17295 [Polyangiaceae bacterium]
MHLLVLWERACANLRRSTEAKWVRWAAPKLRLSAVCLVLLWSVAYFVSVVGPHYPLKDWLFFRYARYWGYSALFALSCVCSGHRLLLWLAPKRRPLLEWLTLSFPLGVLAFYVGVFVFGLFGVLGKAFAFLWPTALCAAGFLPLQRHVRVRVRRAAYLRAHIPALQPRFSRLITAFGLANLVVVYLTILTPENVGYDSRWYHLAIAEHYAVGHRVAPFTEGWYQGALPHLASFIYTWAFVLPGGLFDQIEQSAHLEFVVLLFLLAGIGPLVRRLAPRLRAPGAWVAFFLFHQLLLQSNFATGNDTFGALWAVPVFIATLEAWKTLDPRACALLGTTIAGALATKYQAISCAAFPVLAIAGRSLWGALGSGWKSLKLVQLHWVRGPLWAGVACIALMSTVWIKNWWWYGDPLYPFLYQHLHLHPWTADSAQLVKTVLEPALWKPTGPLLRRIQETLPVLFNFSFKPNDFAEWTGLLPLFGSLFTLSLPVLPFVQLPRRAWALVVATHVGVFAWYWTHHQDRYLIMIVPWMAAVVVVVILRVWRQGLVPRAILVCLVGLEVVWGGDASFLPIHPMIKDSMLKHSIDFMNSGFRGKRADRFDTFAPWPAIGRSIPEGSKVLIHEARLHLGIGAMSVSDFGGAFQGGISYVRWPKPSLMHSELTRMGVTHVLWSSGRSENIDSIGSELIFRDFVLNFLGAPRDFGNMHLAPMRKTVSDADWSDLVAVLGCGGGYESGVYHVGQLVVLPLGGSPLAQFPKPVKGERAGPIPYHDLEFIVNDHGCRAALPAEVRSSFTHVAPSGRVEFWVRRHTP